MPASGRYLEAQRSVTAAFIADDPTTAVLIPRARVATSGGGYTKVEGVPRDPQTFKLSLLSYDDRPVITIAGVERRIEYHLIGSHDMTIAEGDYWIDSEGTEYEIVGFTEGWDYMTKAFVYRHVPRTARP